jgi:hypothetical protein
MNSTTSRSTVFLLALVIVLYCGPFPGISGGGPVTPDTAFADKGDEEEYARSGDGLEDTQKRKKYYQELNQLDAERDRERIKLEQEYDRELDRMNEEFQRDVAEKDDPAAAEEKYREKRDDLEFRFEEKQQQLSEWYEEKAAEIEGQ